MNNSQETYSPPMLYALAPPTNEGDCFVNGFLHVTAQ